MSNAPHRPNQGARSVPNSTYRLQFHKGFPFSAGRDLARYLAELGISHVYSSPVLTARAGSIHGYDVVDYDAINPELGGEPEFRAMAAALRQRNIGIILDIVPNHMAVGGADNRLWLDLLKHGRNSAYAGWFDVDFDCPDPELNGRVHAPFLGTPIGEALASDTISLMPHGSGYAIAYGEHIFPIRPEDEEGIAAAGIAAYRNVDLLRQLLARQHFVLDWWRNAGDRINWRRFFDITQLAAVRMEEPAAFAAKHAIALRLYREGLIDGLRIDHIDGLGDPARYCLELRKRLDELQPQRPDELRNERAWLVVEKILASGEHVPEDWDVDGSTGYDFMDEVSAVHHQADAESRLAEHWAAISGRLRGFHGEEEVARHQILSHSFDGQRERLLDAMEEAGGGAFRPAEGLTRAALRRAVTSLIAQFRAYRSYATGRDDGVAPGAHFEAALQAALAAPLNDAPALRFIAAVLAGEGAESSRPARIRAIRRFNQLTAPLAAKAVEDTAFYRYGRLLSRNDVGFDAGTLGLGDNAFHRLMQMRAVSSPHSMLATATHDHKRGEDVRARLAVFSEMPEQWIAAAARWRAQNAAIRPPGFDPGDEYMFYQMLVGAWPLHLTARDAEGLSAFSERLQEWSRKALREAKLRSGWAAPDLAYEAIAAEFITAALTPTRSATFLADVDAFVESIAHPGALNGLVQVALRATVPGVPDTYQGTEFWDFSLVDPDNRRPVDFSARRIALSQRLTLDILAQTWRDGRIKQAVLRKFLRFRQSEPELFSSGSYEPLTVLGERADSIIAFMRRHRNKALLVVAARTCSEGMNATGNLVPDQVWWGDTHIALPQPAQHSRVIVGPEIAPAQALPIREVLPVVPVGAWVLQYS
jgi:(1->4)-alpha-D-glucan 1-alpha-D-glucosylmutase